MGTRVFLTVVRKSSRSSTRLAFRPEGSSKRVESCVPSISGTTRISVVGIPLGRIGRLLTGSNTGSPLVGQHFI